ncbi:hypothetical protein GCM10025331_35550 [Actinoplanes utahensis]|uniref:FxSxx-COOH system tetratricopeptide repeat protein n=1 Tax=Actinoplanes utahensis TaxID=1869 RepID=UPI0009FFBE53|nr:FxSxx-COOH system tetratricopeptide repeat protein [Actinoplanes utahensis]GIF32091.1 cytochrome c [Actinoplanes utahensis]
MPQGSSKKDPATDLRDALIKSLIEIPFMSALPDRRLLLQLVRRDVVNFPDVQEHNEVRIHVVQIVLACLGHPGGLRALTAALSTMAPDSPGTKRAVELIDTASLLSLLPESESKRIHDLLRRAETGPGEQGWWRAGAMESGVGVPVDATTLIVAFDRLAARPTGPGTEPSALALVRHVADRVTGSLAIELSHWAADQSDRLEIPDPSPPAVPPEPGGDRRVTGVAGTTPAVPDDPGDDTEVPEPSITPDSPDNSGESSVVYPAEEGIEPVRAGDSDSTSLRGDSAMPPVGTTPPLVRLPQVWGEIPQRNPNFTGREDLLRVIHDELNRSQETAVLPQALHGMGGVGKSQVAIEYVYRHSAEYDLIWWVPAEQEGQILASFTQLAQQLKLDVGPEVNTAVPAVRDALSTGRTPYKNWLLVFDNAEAPQSVKKFFPTVGSGKILVTSRDRDWTRFTRSVEVDVFTREESRDFLLGRELGLDGEDAERLADALGDLPLAIEQAAAWRATTGMPIEEYLDLLEQKRIDVLETSPSPDYPDSVAAAFELSLEKLREKNPAALQLLQICSFFAPEPISRDLFAGSPVAPISEELDPVLSDRFRLSRAIRDIQKYALAKIDHARDALQIHRLVQAVLVGRMTDEERVHMRRGAHTLLANGNPNNPSRPEEWRRYQGLRPHVAVSRAVESADPRVQDLVFGIVQFLYYWGDHPGSEQLAEEAHGWWAKTRGAFHPETLRLAKWLGWMRWVNGDFAGAKQLNQRTLDLYQEHIGDRDEGTLDAMYMVSIDLRTAGEFVAARDLDERILTIARQEFGRDDPATLIFAHSLGVSLRLTGEFKRAAELDEDTHRRRQMILGVHDEQTLNTLNALLIDRRELGHYLEAARRQDELYHQHLELFGNDKPSTLQAARYLAIARRKAGDHPGARALAQDTLDRYTRRYGPDYPRTIAMAVNYAVDLRHAGELDRSLAYTVDTFERYQRMFGANHLYTLSVRTNLAVVLRLMGDREEARQHDAAALAELERTLGPDHAVSLICATNLASDLYALGRFQEAYERDTDTLARSSRVLGDEHPSTLAVGVNLALDLRALGRANEGDKILADTMLRLRATLGDRHPATLNALQSLRADCDVDPTPI